ncbi:MAG: hypothetical protein GX897_02040 [Clostridiales bacterium]|nr:hypothetical protein [Clostridiales bacterium]
MKFTKIILIALAAALLLSVFNACAESAKPADTTAAAEPETTTEETTTAEPVSGVPEDVKFEGESFNLLSANYRDYHWSFVEELNGDVLNDAIFNMRIDAESKLGCEIKESRRNIFEMQKMLSRAAASGDPAYDACNYSGRFATYCMLDGSIRPLEDAAYIDLSAEWWNPDVSADMSMMGKTYFTLGSYNILALNHTMTMLVNNRMLEDFGHHPDTLYNDVDEGKWTYGRLRALMTDVTADLDGDGKMTVDDRWGLSTFFQTDAIGTATVLSCGANMMGKDENGFPILVWDREDTANAMQLAFDIYHSGDMLLDQPGYTADNFIAGKSLFFSTFFMGISYLSEMQDDYGVLPYPKRDEAQEKYLNPTLDPAWVLLPAACRDPEFSGAVLEELSFNGWKTVQGAYRDVTLKYKKTRDENSIRMIDLIFSNLVADIGSTYLFDWCGYDSVFTNVVSKNDFGWASYVEKQTPAAQAELDRIISLLGAVE